MDLEKSMSVYAALVDALTKAVAAAAKAGLGKEVIKAALDQVAELVDGADGE